MDPRATNAFAAMKELTISPGRVKPVLHRLLSLYDGNWDFIEQENYRALADAIFEEKVPEVMNDKVVKLEKSHRAAKKLRSGSEKDKVSSKMDDLAKKIMPQENGTSPTESQLVIFEPSMTNLTDNKDAFDPQSVLPSNERRDQTIPVIEETQDGSMVTTLLSQTAQDGPKRSSRGLSRAESSGKLSNKKQSETPASQDTRIIKPVEKQPVCLIDDITNGKEKVKISLVNDVGKRDPPTFFYISDNLVYQSAHVAFSISRFSEDDCCRSCSGNCLSSQVPCACARETGGEFAYGPDGLLKEEFLNACIDLKNKPQENQYVYCQDCPLERIKNESKPEPCSGHLVRRFIKECWSLCGCGMKCGNRIVQQGITRNLQVFWTPQGKGWGVRCTEDIPKGAFVFEYVGEILTNTELFQRNQQNRGSKRHTYPVYLDADWGSESILQDEEALCLDATSRGNVARFVNHRCNDANLLDVPVEVETLDRHYYHLAFFTTREVKAFEELTWDYGIDFSDLAHPIKAFRCQCGSSQCGDTSRRAKGKRKAR